MNKCLLFSLVSFCYRLEVIEEVNMRIVPRDRVTCYFKSIICLFFIYEQRSLISTKVGGCQRRDVQAFYHFSMQRAA